jgi:hypothetical protein
MREPRGQPAGNRDYFLCAPTASDPAQRGASLSHQTVEMRSGDVQWSLRPLSTAARATGYAVQETGAGVIKHQKRFEAANTAKKVL